MIDLLPPFRRARVDDAAALAALIDRAGEGIPRCVWALSADSGQDPFEVGALRAARVEGGFSYLNAVVLEIRDQVAGMVLSYRLDDPYDTGDVSAVPRFVRPLIELESEAAGSWYINAVAVDQRAEGRGYGRTLMDIAGRLGINDGASELSLIVAADNTRARGLYERLGYVDRSHRRAEPAPGLPDHGDWVLMVKAL
jgi:ribosomal protein S18 acetylase RimI-like enzyme